MRPVDLNNSRSCDYTRRRNLLLAYLYRQRDLTSYFRPRHQLQCVAWSLKSQRLFFPDLPDATATERTGISSTAINLFNVV
jgi:hypothetical protein